MPPGVIVNLKGKSRSLVWLGSHIVNTSGCNGCNTHPSHLPGSNPLQGQPEDLYAVHAYLRAIPSLPDNPHPGP